MQKKYTNNELIAGCKRNSRHIQEHLYRAYFTAMLHLGFRFTADEDRLLEWINDGFLKVYKSIHTVKNPAALPGWIRSVIYRAILDGIRKEKKYLNGVVLDISTNIPGNGYRVVNGYDFDCIMQFVDELPISSSKVFKLFVVEGYSHKDIAGKLGISEGTSKWHLNNARNKLKETLVKHKVIINE